MDSRSCLDGPLPGVPFLSASAEESTASSKARMRPSAAGLLKGTKGSSASRSERIRSRSPVRLSAHARTAAKSPSGRSSRPAKCFAASVSPCTCRRHSRRPIGTVCWTRPGRRCSCEGCRRSARRSRAGKGSVIRMRLARPRVCCGGWENVRPSVCALSVGQWRLFRRWQGAQLCEAVGCEPAFPRAMPLPGANCRSSRRRQCGRAPWPRAAKHLSQTPQRRCLGSCGSAYLMIVSATWFAPLMGLPALTATGRSTRNLTEPMSTWEWAATSCLRSTSISASDMS